MIYIYNRILPLGVLDFVRFLFKGVIICAWVRNGVQESYQKMVTPKKSIGQ